MGPKKEKLDREPTIKRRLGNEFSDTEFISEDEEQVPPEGNEEHLRNRLGSSSIPLEKRLDRPKPGRQVATRQPRGDVTEEIIRPKPKKESDKPGAPKRICSSVFLWQLFITVVCVALVNFAQVSFLNQSVHVSDSTVNFVDLENKVKEAIDSKVPKSIDTRFKDLARNEAKAAVTDFDLTNVIDTKLAEQKWEILSDIKENVFSRIGEVKDKYDTLADNLFQKKQDVEKVADKASSLEKDLQSFVEEQENAQTEIDKRISDLNDKSSKITELSENYAVLSETTKSHSISNVKLQETLQIEKEKVDTAISNITNELKVLHDTLSDAKDLYEKYKDKLEQLSEVNRKLEQMQPNMFNKEKFTMAFMILVLIVLGLAFALFCLYQRQNYMSHGLTTTASNHFNNMDSSDILRNVPRAVELKQEVCIISFDESRVQDHRKILDSANVPNLQVQSCVIRRHGQIPNMPRSKVYLMCTEFSERHVIIEEPGKGLGDLHRTTYQAAKKLGGCLIILYTKDPGSRNLNDNLLYNTRIHCVTHQPELSELNDDGRFFSLYDKLTQHQKNELRNKIGQNMA